MSLIAVLRDVVVPAIDAVIYEDVEQLSLVQDVDGNIELLFRIGEDVFTDRIVQTATPLEPAEWQQRLLSNLEDFVAESSFAWGQNRDAQWRSKRQSF